MIAKVEEKQDNYKMDKDRDLHKSEVPLLLIQAYLIPL